MTRSIVEYEAVMGQGCRMKTITPVPFPNPSRVDQCAANMFELAYSQIEREVAFSLEWGDGSGFLDYVCYDKKLAAQLKPGEFARTSDEYGRKIILIGTRYGAVAIFQRYPGDSLTLVKNLPLQIRQMNLIDNNGRLGYDDLYLMLGKPGAGNLGQLLEMKG
jgi:hypothetical protein